MAYSFHHTGDIVVASIDCFERNADWQRLKNDLRKLLGNGNRKLMIDLGNVKEMPVSAFWSILITVKKEYDSAGGKFVVAGQSGAALDDSMAALGLTKVFNVTATAEDAMLFLSS